MKKTKYELLMERAEKLFDEWDGKALTPELCDALGELGKEEMNIEAKEKAIEIYGDDHSKFTPEELIEIKLHSAHVVYKSSVEEMLNNPDLSPELREALEKSIQ